MTVKIVPVHIRPGAPERLFVYEDDYSKARNHNYRGVILHKARSDDETPHTTYFIDGFILAEKLSPDMHKQIKETCEEISTVTLPDKEKLEYVFHDYFPYYHEKYVSRLEDGGIPLHRFLTVGTFLNKPYVSPEESKKYVNGLHVQASTNTSWPTSKAHMVATEKYYQEYRKEEASSYPESFADLESWQRTIFFAAAEHGFDTKDTRHLLEYLNDVYSGVDYVPDSVFHALKRMVIELHTGPIDARKGIVR